MVDENDDLTLEDKGMAMAEDAGNSVARAFGHLRLSLGTKFIVLTIVIVLTTMGIAGVFNIKKEEEVLMRHLLSKGEALGRFTALISPEAILGADFVALESYVKDISKDEDIVYGVIQSAEGEPLTSYVPANDGHGVDALQKANFNTMDLIARIDRNKDIIPMEFPIIFDEEKIGVLKLGVTRKFVNATTAESIEGYLLQLGLIIIVLSGTIYVAFRSMALKPIRLLIAALERIGKGDLSEDVALPCRDEIGDLAWALNAMTHRLRVSLAENKQVTGQLREKANELEYLNTHLEQLVKERTHELAEKAGELTRSNRELDQFAYVTSHDLKAPLRAIANLSQWIEEDIGEQLEGDTRKQMDLLRSRVKRMEDLIDGILQYSRVGRGTVDIENVDVGELLEETIDALSPPEGITIDIGPDMPAFETARVRLSQVFANLISNAIKYHHRSDGSVEVSVQDNNDSYEFTVADNGPGIAPEFHEKVFQIFQTLQAKDTRESTGVGLTLVKKIVEEQGGSISLDSVEGQGASFRFTWPKRPAKSVTSNKV